MGPLQITDAVRETSFAIHKYHGPGHLEKIYENALANRLRKAGHKVQQQFPLTVYDEDEAVLGEYYADLLVDEILIVELKATKTIAPEHVAQVFGYLKSSGMEHGVLVNFGAPKLQIKKYILTSYRDSSPGRLLTSLAIFASSVVGLICRS
ncbi:MAG: GxxExxY protein [Verrucomicrobia bacterium]|nr:GxxExxY protein [Verrucomicrobiota bacterium]